MIRGSGVQFIAVRQAAFRQITPGAADKIVRLAYWRGDNPFATRSDSSTLADASSNVVVVASIVQLDARHIEAAEMQKVRVIVDQPGHHAGPINIDFPRRRTC
ncbi:hypothetical protein FQZ97_902130 [compost metagenome]